MTDPQTELLSFDINHVKKLLPHRYPFLYVDKMRDVVLGKSAVGIKNVTINENIFLGHFPDKPIFPGVLIVEAMAQTASALVVESLGLADNKPLVYFMSLDATKFRKTVEPGDQLELHVDLIRKRGKVWKFGGKGIVDGNLVAESEFTAMIVLPKDV
jgi:3-hydroxyacyl-[acyl-carrier-protein] dehydratase